MPRRSPWQTGPPPTRSSGAERAAPVPDPRGVRTAGRRPYTSVAPTASSPCPTVRRTQPRPAPSLRELTSTPPTLRRTTRSPYPVRGPAQSRPDAASIPPPPREGVGDAASSPKSPSTPPSCQCPYSGRSTTRRTAAGSGTAPPPHDTDTTRRTGPRGHRRTAVNLPARTANGRGSAERRDTDVRDGVVASARRCPAPTPSGTSSTIRW